MTTFLQVKNRSIGVLVATIGAGDLSFSVLTGQGASFPSAFPFEPTIDNEIVHVTNRVGDIFTITRPAQGTTASSHAAGAIVSLNITAQLISDLNTAVNTLETNIANYLPLSGGVMSGALILGNNVALQAKDTGGTARNLLILNNNNCLFLSCPPFVGGNGSVIYIGHNASAGDTEISFFGCDGASTYNMSSFWDCHPALVGDQLQNSPRFHERAGVWNGADFNDVTDTIAFTRQNIAVTAGNAATRAGYMVFKYGNYGAEVEFMRFNMAAGPVYSLIVGVDLNIGAHALKTTNYQIVQTGTDGGCLEFRKLTDAEGASTLEVLVGKMVMGGGGFAFASTNGQALAGPNADGWYWKVTGRGTGTSAVEMMRFTSGNNGGAGPQITTASGVSLGFYGHAAQAQQTGVAVTDAAIHAALVNLGLITA